MKIIGITGPSGAGKSLLCEAFKQRNIPTVDADAIYHFLLVPPSECLDAIRAAFGEGVISSDGTLDRAALGAIVFSDEQKLALLNSTVLSRVLDKIWELIAEYAASGADAIAIDAPTLIESGFHHECDAVISVLAPKEDRIARIVARDSISQEKAELRVNAQNSDDFYTDASDYVLTNNGTAEVLLDRADEIISEILFAEGKNA